MSAEHAYLSILQWPDDLCEDGKIEALVAAAAMDIDQARLRIRRGLPQVVCRIDAATADHVLDELHRRSVLAFAPTQREIRSIAAPIAVKRLIPRHEGDGYVCEPWRGDGDAFSYDDIFLIVHADIRQVTRTSTPGAGSPAAFMGGYVAAGLPGALLADGLSRAGPDTTTRGRFSEILDLYRRDGSRLRLDTSKLSFCVLGDGRGMTDRENMARLIDLLRRQMPKAMFDRGLGGFICPADIITTEIRGSGHATIRRVDTAPLVEFYSPWAFLMYRHLLGG